MGKDIPSGWGNQVVRRHGPDPPAASDSPFQANSPATGRVLRIRRGEDEDITTRVRVLAARFLNPVRRPEPARPRRVPGESMRFSRPGDAGSPCRSRNSVQPHGTHAGFATCASRQDLRTQRLSPWLGTIPDWGLPVALLDGSRSSPDRPDAMTGVSRAAFSQL